MKLPIFVTFEVFQEEISLSNEDAPENMYCMSVTCEVSHEEISALKELKPRNAFFIEVTLLVSQLGIVP